MLPKEDRKAMLLRLFNEDTPLQDHSKDRFRAKTDLVKGENHLKDEVVVKNEEDEEDEVGEAEVKGQEHAASADVKDEIAVIEEGEGVDMVPAGLGGDGEGGGEGQGGRGDGVLLDGTREEIEDGV